MKCWRSLTLVEENGCCKHSTSSLVRKRCALGVLLTVGICLLYLAANFLLERDPDGSKLSPEVAVIKSDKASRTSTHSVVRSSSNHKAVRSHPFNSNDVSRRHHHPNQESDIIDKKNEDHRNSADYCIWSPSNPRNCQKVLTDRIAKRTTKDDLSRYRWLFLGDSTVAQFWYTSSLHGLLVDLAANKMKEESDCDDYLYTQCHAKRIEQECHLNQAYNLPPPLHDHWDAPQLGEGPKVNATTIVDAAGSCLACKSCLSSFIECGADDEDDESNNDATTTTSNADTRNVPRSSSPSSSSSSSCRPILHGGYIAMPFARDVILQTPRYRTSQENLLLEYLPTHLSATRQQPRSICVARTGMHDMALPNMTTSLFVTNVQWYLDILLQRLCSHVIWLQNTAPLLHDEEVEQSKRRHNNNSPAPPRFPQTVERVRAYDKAVYKMVRNNNRENVTTMDVWDASLHWPHADNIHLNSDWNRALGMFFVKLATKLTVK